MSGAVVVLPVADRVKVRLPSRWRTPERLLKRMTGARSVTWDEGRSSCWTLPRNHAGAVVVGLAHFFGSVEVWRERSLTVRCGDLCLGARGDLCMCACAGECHGFGECVGHRTDDDPWRVYVVLRGGAL